MTVLINFMEPFRVNINDYAANILPNFCNKSAICDVCNVRRSCIFTINKIYFSMYILLFSSRVLTCFVWLPWWWLTLGRMGNFYSGHFTSRQEVGRWVFLGVSTDSLWLTHQLADSLWLTDSEWLWLTHWQTLTAIMQTGATLPHQRRSVTQSTSFNEVHLT